MGRGHAVGESRLPTAPGIRSSQFTLILTAEAAICYAAPGQRGELEVSMSDTKLPGQVRHCMSMMSFRRPEGTFMSVPDASLHRRQVIAGTIGNVMEWYDFAVYGYFVSVIAKHFFPPTIQPRR